MTKIIKKYFQLVWLILLTITMNGQLTSVTAQDAVSGLDYAPGLYYQFYDYSGEGNEFVPYKSYFDYAPDEAGIYQISVDNTGTTVSYVYQIREDGIYELAYFPESYEQNDFRYSEDATDGIDALFLPASLEVGTTFSRGYKADQDYVVTDILAEFELEDITYYNVVVIESTFETGEVQRYYYAPKIGEIYSEYVIDESMSFTTTINILRGPTYQ